MKPLERSEVLFVGWGDIEGVSWYRTWLPAKAMGAEAVVFDMNFKGVGRIGSRKSHEIIVLQHCWEHWQLRMARSMRKVGSKLIINVDDWIPAVRKLGSAHSLSDHFGKDRRVEEWKNLIRESDGVIASTPWLAERLRTLHPNVAVARNGVDLDRYELHRSEKHGPVRTIGWAGGTGHEGSFLSIVPAIVELMEDNPDLEFVMVGDHLRHLLPSSIQDRVKSHAWSQMRMYPRFLDEIDINLAPAMHNDFFKAKSQLRFYEACAMGNPTVGDHHVYDEILSSKAGHGYLTHGEMKRAIQQLLDGKHILINAYRRRALDYRKEIDINNRIHEWTAAIDTLTSP